MYTQERPTPIHSREDLLEELDLMQCYGIVTTLPFSKYSSPLFAQRKPSGALRLLTDLRRVNLLIRHDYDSLNFPITTLADASAHLAGKKLFVKLDRAAKHILRCDWPILCQCNFCNLTFSQEFLLSRVWLGPE